MKKLLLLAATALTASGSMLAFGPSVYPGMAFNGLSPDGNYALSYVYEAMTIFDFKADKSYEYEELYTPGNGNYISNTGIVVGSKIGFDSACFFQNGEWHDMPDVDKHSWSFANGITSTGTRIVGNVTPEGVGEINYDGLMLVPCYWDLQADGTYSDAIYLPHPELDLTGRAPQYITAVRVSEDGKTIAGQIQDYSGTICQPIVYTQNGSGEWTYTLILNDLFHPKGINLPEDPGDGPSINPEDYMTPEEQKAYDLAYQQWYNSCLESDNWDYSTCPNAEDYLSEEGKNKLEAAKAEYEVWNEKYNAFYKAFEELQKLVPAFDFNNVFLSTDGTFYACTDMKYDFDFETYEPSETFTPYLINIADLNNVTYTTYPNNNLNITVTSLADDGTLLGQAYNNDHIAQAYVLPTGASVFETLYSYIASKNTSLGEWMKKNMTHTYIGVDDETWDYVEKTEIFTGMPFTTPTMSVFALAVENGWYEGEDSAGEDDAYIPYYGYIFSADASGVDVVEAKGSIDMKVLSGATLAFAGDVSGVNIYTLQGTCVFSVKSPAETLSTGLSNGIYVVKAVSKDGSAIIRKVIFQ